MTTFVLSDVFVISLFNSDSIMFNIYVNANKSDERYIEVITKIDDIILRDLFNSFDVPRYIQNILKYSKKMSSMTRDDNGIYILNSLDIMNGTKNVIPIISYSYNPIGSIIKDLDIKSANVLYETHKNVYKSIYIAMKSLSLF
jgi:hypothetical protein